MKAKLKIPFRLLMLLAAACGPVRIPAQETSFNYQGRLVDNGVAATGTYDFIFSVYDAATGGTILAPAVPVNAGQFAAPLDFGAGVFTGAMAADRSPCPGRSGIHSAGSPAGPVPHALRDFRQNRRKPGHCGSGARAGPVSYVFRITGVEQEGNDLRLSFNSKVGSRYVIESSADLLPETWVPLPGPAISGNGGVV